MRSELTVGFGFTAMVLSCPATIPECQVATLYKPKVIASSRSLVQRQNACRQAPVHHRDRLPVRPDPPRSPERTWILPYRGGSTPSNVGHVRSSSSIRHKRIMYRRPSARSSSAALSGIGEQCRPLQLPVDVLPVRLGAGNPGRRLGRPRAPARARPPHVYADRAVADAQCRGDLLVAPPRLVLQAHYFSNVRHGQPLLSHRLPPFVDRPLRGWKNAPLPKASQRRYSLTTGWMACVGIRKSMQTPVKRIHKLWQPLNPRGHAGRHTSHTFRGIHAWRAREGRQRPGEWGRDSTYERRKSVWPLQAALAGLRGSRGSSAWFLHTLRAPARASAASTQNEALTNCRCRGTLVFAWPAGLGEGQVRIGYAPPEPRRGVRRDGVANRSRV